MVIRSHDSFEAPADFLDAVAETHWLRRPGAWAAPFPAPYATEAEVFDGLVALRGRIESGEEEVFPRVFGGDRPAAFEVARHLPRAEDGDLAGFEARVAAERATADTGMVVGDAATLTPTLWRRAMGFLGGLYARVGMPAGGAHAEVFFGDYARSFFGVHKDRLETFTFVVRGRKRFLVWPLEVLAEAAGLDDGATFHAFNFDNLDLAPYRAQATVLEGGPGDVLYWPASHWHEAVQSAPGFVTTLTLALAPSTMLAAGSPLRLAQEGFDEAGRDGYAPLDPALPAPRDGAAVQAAIARVEASLTRVLTDPRFVAAREDATLQWLSAMGFKRGPVRLAVPTLDPDDRLTVLSPVLQGTPREGGVTCAANGILLASDPAYLPLVERLSAGGTHRVGDLVAAFASTEGHPTAEGVVEALAHLTAAHALGLVG